MRESALATPTTFWEAARHRYAPEIAALADSARDALTLRDLRALAAAELVEIERQIEHTTVHKQRTILRGAARQCRRDLALLVIAESPTMDLNSQLVPIPEGMMPDRGLPAAERTARRAERTAALEAEKARILDGILAGTEPRDSYLDKLHRTPREELLRLRDDALRARLRGEDEARAAWAELERQRATGAVVYALDLDDAAVAAFGDVDGDGNELEDEIAAELRDDFGDDDDRDDLPGADPERDEPFGEPWRETPARPIPARRA